MTVIKFLTKYFSGNFTPVDFQVFFPSKRHIFLVAGKYKKMNKIKKRKTVRLADQRKTSNRSGVRGNAGNQVFNLRRRDTASTMATKTREIWREIFSWASSSHFASCSNMRPTTTRAVGAYLQSRSF